ncbi:MULTISPECIES: hypothetical protein [Burkholderia]|uniref:hypothetical protein n=1 Tax=Burkholderia TaxID=32008 RepID=UPI00136BB9A9|nr:MULTISPECIES: hypothetical protein [Burkholderia]URV26171.1 hypothetical protein NAL90_07095 [Burkholderia gladioli]
MEYEIMVGHMDTNQPMTMIGAAHTENRRLTIEMIRNKFIAAAAKMRLIRLELDEAEQE